MKRLLVIIILTFSFQSWTKADDIRDLQIEGMSIGDSLLDYMTINKIKIAENNPTYYKNNIFIVIFSNIESEKYDRIQITYKPDDKKFIIHEIQGVVDMKNNFKECKKIKKEVMKSVKDLFKNSQKIDETKPHDWDKSKNSIVESSWRYPNQGGYAHIACTKWSEEMFKKNGWVSNFQVTVGSEEFKLFLQNVQYN